MTDFILRHIVSAAPALNALRKLQKSNVVKNVVHVPVIYQWVDVNNPLVEVEVKRDSSTNGWLYDTTCKLLVLDCGDGSPRVISLDEIREGCTKQLSGKKFIEYNEKPVAGCMKLQANGRVIGWVTDLKASV